MWTSFRWCCTLRPVASSCSHLPTQVLLTSTYDQLFFHASKNKPQLSVWCKILIIFNLIWPLAYNSKLFMLWYMTHIEALIRCLMFMRYLTLYCKICSSADDLIGDYMAPPRGHMSVFYQLKPVPQDVVWFSTLKLNFNICTSYYATMCFWCTR